MINLNWGTVGKLAVKFCGLALYGLLATKSFGIKIDVSDRRNGTDPGYRDAIDAIVESGMLDSTKEEVAEVLKRNECAEYYRSVISIVNGGMMDSTKLNMIERLNEK